MITYNELFQIEGMACPGPIERRFRERVYPFIHGRYSQRVVAERLAEEDRVQRVMQRRFDEWRLEKR